MNNIYIFTEGGKGKSQHQFWELINRFVYKGNLKIIPCDGISNVTYAIAWMAVFNQAIGLSDIIIIDIDNVMENNAVRYSIDRLKLRVAGSEPWVYKDTQGKVHKINKNLSNAYMLDLLCFEDVILKFEELTKWIYSVYDRQNSNKVQQLLDVYKEYLDETKKRKVEGDCYRWRNNKTLINFYKQCKNQNDLSSCSMEVLADLLLVNMTKLSKGHFRTTKAVFGKCFYTECKSKNCVLAGIKNKGVMLNKTKTCGLYYSCERVRRKGAEQKIMALYRCTDLYTELVKCKRELLKRNYRAANAIKV